jgi:hypothetical protein
MPIPDGIVVPENIDVIHVPLNAIVTDKSENNAAAATSNASSDPPCAKYVRNIDLLVRSKFIFKLHLLKFIFLK